MHSFHLACPYTSLPVCRCLLHTPAPPRHQCTPITKAPRPPRENPLRRALLLELAQSCAAPTGTPQHPSPALTHALHHKATHGSTPPPAKLPRAPALHTALAAAGAYREERLVEAGERAARLAERAARAAEDVGRLAAAREREEADLLHNRFVERRAPSPRTPESDSADELFARRRAAAKRRSRARAKHRR